MDFKIRAMRIEDWERVAEIYRQGISTGKATFQTVIPEYAEWDKGHLEAGRLVAVDHRGSVIGWVALSPTSSRCVYRGVAEVSVYVSDACRGMDVGRTLLMREIEESEKAGIWTLQSGIFAINESSIGLHKKCGFRVVGVREKIGQDFENRWQDTVLMERRSKTVGI